MGEWGLLLLKQCGIDVYRSEGAESRRGVQKELQEKLAQRGLPKSGNKAELAQRLHAALAEEQEMVLQDQMEAQDELQRHFQESMMNPTRRRALGKPYLTSALCAEPKSLLAYNSLLSKWSLQSRCVQPKARSITVISQCLGRVA